MSDIATFWNQAAAASDYAMAGTQLATGGDLATAILISVMSDRLAELDDVIPDGTSDARGWWGDLEESTRIGSRIWLLSRSKRTDDVLLRARNYLEEALQWLIDDGVVVKFDIVTEFVGDQLHAGVTAHRSDGATVAQRFTWVWDSLTPSTGSFTV